MLDPYIETVERRRKRFTVYTADGTSDLADRLATRNVTVVERRLPPTAPSPFVVVHDDETFAGAIGLEQLETLLTPPVVRPGTHEGLSVGYRALLDVLEETLFVALTRGQLLATSREIEDRARRLGRGTLHVSMQHLSVFETQAAVYRRLGSETDLDIHIYGEPDWTPPDIPNVTYHRDEAGSLTQFWCLAFDGDDQPSQACTLVARQRGAAFVGFWSYDVTLVDDVIGTLRSVADGVGV